MTYFLENIAKTVYAEFGNSLNRHCMVFPSRRAGLYFMKYLAACIDKPVWSPSVMTINELFRSFSPLQLAGNEVLLFELYKVYRSLKKDHESFDDFYFFGDMLLNDFDDVDKYLVSPSLLFMNIRDVREIDEKFGGLTEVQVAVVRKFWTNFNIDNATREKSGFINIWSILAEMYTMFRDNLKSMNIAYEGMIFREVAGDALTGISVDDRWDIVHFVGFNALNECEKALMNRFKKDGKARFYWDYDNSYIKEGGYNSAGYFIRDNIRHFGNDMPADWSYNTCLASENIRVKRRVVETSSDLAQVKLITRLLKEIPELNSENAHHTAVVLADENLLMPLLTSLPEDMGDINITMGHPLKQTIVYVLVRHLMDLQRNSGLEGGEVFFDYDLALNIIRHPLFAGLSDPETIKSIEKEIQEYGSLRIPARLFRDSEIFSFVFSKRSSPSELSSYFKELLSLVAASFGSNNPDRDDNLLPPDIVNEFIFRIVLAINRLEPIAISTEVSFTSETYLKILDRLLRMQSVPFSGEPLTGIQIMGILETRALDFKNLVVLSVNEGVLPVVTAGSSFIPFNLREAFGLPSLNHQESVFAYHFYRLLERAENVTLVYNSNSEGLRTGEMSRFVIQMRYDKVLKPEFLSLDFEVKSQPAPGNYIERTDGHLHQLEKRFLDKNTSRPLSPSAINTWLNCRMKFLYRYIYDLKEPEELSAEIDPAMLGSILHDIMRKIYLPFRHRSVDTDFLKKIIADRKALEVAINESVNDNFKGGREGLISGSELIVREVLMSYLLRILRYDAAIAPFTVISLEDPFSFNMGFNSKSKPATLSVGGKIDRVDSSSGLVRIVDYKTGKVADSIKSIDDLFEDDRKKDYDGWLQTLIYCEAYLSSGTGVETVPVVYNIKNLGGDNKDGMLKIKPSSKNEVLLDKYSLIRQDFLAALGDLISIIFSENEPFSKTTDNWGKCSYCQYRLLCMR